jgi:ribulose-phosphate 3-epimerase
MIEVIPAIIPKSFEDLNEHLELVAGLVPLVQIDINDGKFTPYKSWPYIKSPDPDFVKIIREDEGFPYWEELEFEFHFMVVDPQAYVQEWISAGARRIIVQYESFANGEEVRSFAEKFQKEFGKGGGMIGTELGIALDMKTDISVLDSIFEKFDYVQLMGIDHDGAQGSVFDEKVLDKVIALRSAFHDLPISVDGGVTMGNAASLIGAGATRLVIGSAIFQSDDIPETIEEFESLGNDNEV